MGGGLLQRLNRDTQRFAFKASWAKVNGSYVDIYKEPVTDTGKNSKRGRLDLLELSKGKVSTVTLGKYPGVPSLLVPVFKNGEILKKYSFDEVRKNSIEGIYKQYNGWKDYKEPWEYINAD